MKAFEDSEDFLLYEKEIGEIKSLDSLLVFVSRWFEVERSVAAGLLDGWYDREFNRFSGHRKSELRDLAEGIVASIIEESKGWLDNQHPIRDRNSISTDIVIYRIEYLFFNNLIRRGKPLEK